MEITERALWTLIHGMGFGGLYLLACSGALVGFYQLTASSTSPESTHGQDRFVRIYLTSMVVLAWTAVRNHRQLRAAVRVFSLASLVAAGIAGLFGAEIDDHAPIQGGSTIQLSRGGAK